jgi:hypothetical protein
MVGKQQAATSYRRLLEEEAWCRSRDDLLCNGAIAEGGPGERWLAFIS